MQTHELHSAGEKLSKNPFELIKPCILHLYVATYETAYCTLRQTDKTKHDLP